MANSIVFFNTGWMDFYKGITNDTITGGGKHVDKEGWGGEMYNFNIHNRKAYGYVQPKIDKKYGNESTIKIEKLGATVDDEKISGITVVWTAKKPGSGGTFIVGWYKNATVYRKVQRSPKSANRKYKNIDLGYYYTTANSNSITLLPIDERVVNVKRQKKNWMGQSNVWYAENNPAFVKLVSDYIFNGKIPNNGLKKSKPKGSPRQPDLLKRIKVEENAIKITTRHFENLGYVVKSVEKDNVGWDLTAAIGKTKLKLEVKGLSGESVLTELTPNEYKNLQSDLRDYRICIVTEALLKKPRLKIFSYSAENNSWTNQNGESLVFEKVISAKIYI